MFPTGTLIAPLLSSLFLFGIHASSSQALIIQTLRVFDLVWLVYPLQCLLQALELFGVVLLSVCVCSAPQLPRCLSFASASTILRIDGLRA